jgi:hypothetical protein
MKGRQSLAAFFYTLLRGTMAVFSYTQLQHTTFRFSTFSVEKLCFYSRRKNLSPSDKLNLFSVHP